MTSLLNSNKLERDKPLPYDNSDGMIMADLRDDDSNKTPKPAWGQIQVEMTSRCNLRCRTCLYPVYEDRWIIKDLSSDAFAKLLATARRVDSIHLQGWGETLLRPDTAQRIRDLHGSGTQPTLSSNGTIMTTATAGALIASGLQSMTFSLAGPDAESHDALRGRATFDTTIDSIRTFASQRTAAGNPPLLVNYLLTPYSFSRLPKALALCSRLGVDTLVATHLVHVCTTAQKPLACYDTGRGRGWMLFRSRLAVLWRHTGLVLPGMKASPLPVCCKNPLENLFLAVDGVVSPCVYLCPPIHGGYARLVDGVAVPQQRQVMGNLERNDLEEIWNQPDYKRFREPFQRRLALYRTLMPPLRTDFEGLQQLQRATRNIKAAFETPPYRPPEPCRGCPHLWGY